MFNFTSRQEVCSVSGPPSDIFGSELALFDHRDSSQMQSSLTSTLFVSGFSASRLHYVQELHIIKDALNSTTLCLYQSGDYVISR